MSYPMRDPIARLLPRIQFTVDDCWTWTGRIDRDGYGVAWLKGKQRRAHRVIYELVHMRAIPEELVVDHLCRNRRCVKPSHLELTTAEENVARGAACRCGDCPRCKRNAYMRLWYAQRKAAAF